MMNALQKASRISVVAILVALAGCPLERTGTARNPVPEAVRPGVEAGPSRESPPRPPLPPPSGLPDLVVTNISFLYHGGNQLNLRAKVVNSGPADAPGTAVDWNLCIQAQQPPPWVCLDQDAIHFARNVPLPPIPRNSYVELTVASGLVLPSTSGVTKYLVAVVVVDPPAQGNPGGLIWELSEANNVREEDEPWTN